MTKHTPGPWHSEPHSLHEIAFRITSTAPQSVGGDRTVTVAKYASVADARLIAAAPDLLDLARNIAGMDHRYIAGGNDVVANALREWKAQARAAIAKATGEA